MSLSYKFARRLILSQSEVASSITSRHYTNYNLYNSLFVYLFGSYLWSNMVLTYIFCILFLAFDFWTVFIFSAAAAAARSFCSLTD